MDYREKYREHYGISFGDEYDVHHIDLNHKNDDIENLLLLPKRLHHQYHFALSKLSGVNGNVEFKALTDGDESITLFDLSALSDLVAALKECREWLGYKYYSYEDMPCFHKTALGGKAI